MAVLNQTETETHAHIHTHRLVLVLLETQVCNLSDPPRGVPAAAQLRKNILNVLSVARNAHPLPLIIHVRNCGEQGEPDEPYTTGWELMFPPSESSVLGNGTGTGGWGGVEEIVVDKLKNNAFSGTKLGELVSEDAEIVVVGIGSDFSVRATCSAALNRGNTVILIRGAHGTYDRVEVLHRGGITSSSRIEAEVEAELEEAGVLVLEMKDVQDIFADR